MRNKPYLLAVFPAQLTAPVGLSGGTIHVMIYVMLIGVLLTALFAGAFFVLNYGLFSKRPDDEKAHHEPSDLHIFQGQTHAGEAYRVNSLPAEEEDVGSIVEIRPRVSPNSAPNKTAV